MENPDAVSQGPKEPRVVAVAGLLGSALFNCRRNGVSDRFVPSPRLTGCRDACVLK